MDALVPFASTSYVSISVQVVHGGTVLDVAELELAVVPTLPDVLRTPVFPTLVCTPVLLLVVALPTYVPVFAEPDAVVWTDTLTVDEAPPRPLGASPGSAAQATTHAGPRTAKTAYAGRCRKVIEP
jgi:hypothetical protein